MRGQVGSTYRNLLLRGLPGDILTRLGSDLERVDLTLGRNLFKPEEPITHVYFPENSMASIVANTDGGQSVEIGVVGREGAVGLDVLFGVDVSPHESMVQIGDGGFRITQRGSAVEFAHGGELNRRLLLFNHKLMMQISQTTLCNRLHKIEERLAWWLLMCRDRIDGNVLRLTQEFLATMLGVSRVSVSQAAAALQNLGLIKYARGQITILDDRGLEAYSCECYLAVRREYERVTENS